MGQRLALSNSAMPRASPSSHSVATIICAHLSSQSKGPEEGVTESPAESEEGSKISPHLHRHHHLHQHVSKPLHLSTPGGKGDRARVPPDWRQTSYGTPSPSPNSQQAMDAMMPAICRRSRPFSDSITSSKAGNCRALFVAACDFVT